MEQALRVKYTWKDHLFNISLVLLFILPQNELLYYFVPVAILFLTDWGKSQAPQLKTLSSLMLVSLAITFFLNYFTPWSTTKSALKLIEFILLILSFGRLRNFIIIKEYLIFVALYLIVFQFAYQINVPVISQLMDQIYPMSEESMEQYVFRQDLEISDIGRESGRLGGIYFNSNNCASFLEMLLLLVVNERKQFKRLLFLTLVVLIVLGVFSTGSRTSMLVLIAVMFFMFSTGKSSEKWGAMCFIIAAVYYYFNYGSEMRMFAVEEGMDNSFLGKVDRLKFYFSLDVGPLNFLFGCLSGSYLVYKGGGNFPGTDFDIGDVIVAYGFAFVIVLLCFLWYLFKNLGKYNTFLCILIWCFSNTIFMSYRASALFLLITSMYYSKNLKNIKNSR